MPFLKSTLGLLTLQVGIVSFASIFTTLAICILLVNMLSLNKDEPMAWIVMFLSISFLVIIWSIAFTGAYKESNRFISTASIMWTAYIALWVAIVIWSFIRYDKRICIEYRCPDVLWLIKNPWHGDNVKNQMSLHAYGSKVKQTNCTRTICKVLGNVIRKRLTREADTDSKVELSSFNRDSLILSIIISVEYCILLFYSWAILYSYQKQIQCRPNQINHPNSRM